MMLVLGILASPSRSHFAREMETKPPHGVESSPLHILHRQGCLSMAKCDQVGLRLSTKRVVQEELNIPKPSPVDVVSSEET